MARIINPNIIIPSGIKPQAQLATLPPHNIALVNSSHKNIILTAQSGTITMNSPEVTCLGNIIKLIIGPLTIVNLTLNSNQNTKIQNGSFEHDVIIDLLQPFGMGDIISQISSMYVENYNMYNISGTSTSTQPIKTGDILISNSTTPRNFTTPTPSYNVNSGNSVNFILGPYTIAYVGQNILYNSGHQPLFYTNISGISGILHSSIGAPLNSGHAKIFSNCNFNGESIILTRGTYNVGNTPLNINIGSISVGPYTKITLQYNNNNQNKVFQNNTVIATNYNLCDNSLNSEIVALQIDFSDGYIGLGFTTLDTYNFQPSNYQQTCMPSSTSNLMQASSSNNMAMNTANNLMPSSSNNMAMVVPANQVPLPYINQLPNTMRSYYGTASVPDYAYISGAIITPTPSSLSGIIEGFSTNNYSEKSGNKTTCILLIILLILALIYIFIIMK